MATFFTVKQPGILEKKLSSQKIQILEQCVVGVFVKKISLVNINFLMKNGTVLNVELMY